MSKTVTGTDAISYLTSHTFHKDVAHIRETDAYIDVDDAGRRKSRESDSEYSELTWDVLNYFPDAEWAVRNKIDLADAINAVFTAEIQEIELHGRKQEVIKWFHINTDVYDVESLGKHYEFLWPTTGSVPAFDIHEGDIIQGALNAARVGEVIVFQVDDTGNEGTDFKSKFLDESGELIAVVQYGDRLQVTQYK